MSNGGKLRNSNTTEALQSAEKFAEDLRKKQKSTDKTR